MYFTLALSLTSLLFSIPEFIKIARLSDDELEEYYERERLATDRYEDDDFEDYDD